MMVDASVVAENALEHVTGLHPGTAIVAQATEALATGIGLQSLQQLLARHQAQRGVQVFAKERADRQVQALLDRRLQRQHAAQLELAAGATAPGPAHRQGQQAVGDEIADVLDVDGEQEDFLGTIGVAVAEAVLAEVCQVGADRRTQLVEGLVLATDFRRHLRLRSLQQAAGGAQHQTGHVGQPQDFASSVGQADVGHLQPGFVEVARHARLVGLCLFRQQAREQRRKGSGEADRQQCQGQVESTVEPDRRRTAECVGRLRQRRQPGQHQQATEQAHQQVAQRQAPRHPATGHP